MKQPLSFRTASLGRHLFCALRLGFVAGLVGGCAPPGDLPDGDDARDASRAEALGRTRYVALEDVLDDETRRRWGRVRARLFEQFDEICADTFCAGDWSNLEPLRLSCSASSRRGEVRECVWSFAASDEVVEAAGGTITTTIPTFTCRFRPRGRARDLVDALESDPLWAALPGGEPSIYDRLGACFEAPSLDEPLPDVSLDGPYVDVTNGLDDGDIDAWYGMRAELRVAYEESTEGDLDAPRPLRLICSEDENTRAIGSCAWIFAGSIHERRASGRHQTHDERHACAFHPRATAAELAAALGPLPTAEIDPLDRPIPGGVETLRDVLDTCLAD